MSSSSSNEKLDQKFRKRQVARAGINQLVNLPEELMQCRLLDEWLNGESAFQERALWIIEEIFQQAAHNGLNGRSLYKAAHLFFT